MLKAFFEAYTAERTGNILGHLKRVDAYCKLLKEYNKRMSALENRVAADVKKLLVSYGDSLDGIHYCYSDRYYQAGFFAGSLYAKTGKDFLPRQAEPVIVERMVGNISEQDRWLSREKERLQKTGQALYRSLAPLMLEYSLEEARIAHARCATYAENVCYRAGHHDGIKHGDAFDVSRIVV